jgi:hypothetical protein
MSLVFERECDERVILVVPPSAEPTRIDVTLSKLRPHKNAAKLAFDAPKRVSIDREEVFEQKQQAREGGKAEG